MHHLVTERLHLRPLAASDLEFLAAMHGDPEVARYIGPGRPRSRAESAEWLERALALYETQGLGHLAVVRAADGVLLGRCGLLPFAVARGEGPVRRAFVPGEPVPAGVRTDTELEVGYTFARAAWGQGYATEAARAVRDDAFARLDVSSLISVIHPNNTGSRRVAERNGMRQDGELEAFGWRCLRYSITKAWWAQVT